MMDDQIGVLNEWPPSPMVTITNDKDYSLISVFPPINHENLDVFSIHNIPQSQSPSSSSPSLSTFDCHTPENYSPSLSPPSDSQTRKGGEFTGWLRIGIQILRSKVISTVSSFRNPSPHRSSIWSFGIPAAAVVTFIMVVLMRWKNNRRTLNETRFMKILKEKDERIAQLLHQIAQMNEILIDRHKALAAKVAK